MGDLMYLLLSIILCSHTPAVVGAGLSVGNGRWHGNWFPAPPGQTDNNPTVVHKSEEHGSIVMGEFSEYCDNGKVNLTKDWDNSPINHTCMEDKHPYLPRLEVRPLLNCDYIPKHYSAQHRCMNATIEYADNLPTFGTHRPLWARYGEYRFLPRQRWLHNLEHGAIVMLYHPCANGNEVRLLRKVVTSCLYRHVITPYNHLDSDRPMALVAWGCSLKMSKVDLPTVIGFIRKMALKGPEQTWRDGQFDNELTRPANTVTTTGDDMICPDM